MFQLTPTKILIIAAILLAFFGYRKLPEIGKGLGQAIRNFRKGVSEQDEIDITPQAKTVEKEPEGEQPAVNAGKAAPRRPYRAANRATTARKR